MMFIRHGSHSFVSNDIVPLLFFPASVFVVDVFEGLPSPEPVLVPMLMNGIPSSSSLAHPASREVKFVQSCRSEPSHEKIKSMTASNIQLLKRGISGIFFLGA